MDTKGSSVQEFTGKVIISIEWPDLPQVPDSFVWIKPNNLNWNDFGHISSAAIGFVEKGQTVFQYKGKAAYLQPESREYIGVGDALKAMPNGTKRVIITDNRNVISLATDLEAYRQIIRDAGMVAGNRRLIGAGDLIAIRGQSSWKAVETAALKSDVFRFSLTRQSEAYHAFRNAAPILKGLDQEDISAGPDAVTITIADQFGADAEIDFVFDHEATVPKRTCVIIGKNGVGKSQALGNIARKALRGISRGASDDTDRIVASRVLVFTPGNELTGNFPTEKWKRPATFYKRLSTSRSRQSAGGNTATASIVELSRNDRRIATKSRFSIFLDAVQAINRPDEIAFRSSSGADVIRLTHLSGAYEQRRLELLFDMAPGCEPGRLHNGRFYHLSTGEVRFIKLLAQACTYIENGSLLLLDEPETHLHPNFIARLMSALEGLLADTGSCAIMATHSVYVVREVFHDQVMIVERQDGGKVEVKTPGMRTFGADISSISTFIFGEEDTSFLADDTMRRIKGENLSFDQVHKKYGQLLSREILSELRDNNENI